MFQIVDTTNLALNWNCYAEARRPSPLLVETVLATDCPY